MARITISLSENIAAAATERANAEKRSTSSYVALLIERDVAAYGAPPPAVQELMAQVQEVSTFAPEVVPVLKTALRRFKRSRRPAA